MHFDYNKETNEVTAYVEQDEFELAINSENQYRVFSKKLTARNLKDFVARFRTFFIAVLNNTFVEGEVQEIIAITKKKDGTYVWADLKSLNLNKSPELLTSFIDYTVKVLQQDYKKKFPIDKKQIAKFRTALALLNKTLDENQL